MVNGFLTTLLYHIRWGGYLFLVIKNAVFMRIAAFRKRLTLAKVERYRIVKQSYTVIKSNSLFYKNEMEIKILAFYIDNMKWAPDVDLWIYLQSIIVEINGNRDYRIQ